MMTIKYSLWHIPREVWIKMMEEKSADSNEETLAKLRNLKKEDVSDKFSKLIKNEIKRYGGKYD